MSFDPRQRNVTTLNLMTVLDFVRLWTTVSKKTNDFFFFFAHEITWVYLMNRCNQH